MAFSTLPGCQQLQGSRERTCVRFFDFTRPQDVREAIDGLERHQVRLVLWSSRLDLPASPSSDHLGPLRAYIAEHYCVTAEVDEEEVWIRSEQRVSGRACPRTAGVLEPGSPRGR